MAYMLCEAHFWTFKERLNIPENIIGCYQYHDKNEPDKNISYNGEKISFTEDRDVVWKPSNKRPERLKSLLKEVEELLTHEKVVRLKWLSRKLLQVYTTSATVITFVVCPYTGDADKVYIDKSVTGKLMAEVACDVLLADNFLMVIYPDRGKIDYVHFNKRPSTAKKFHKLSSLDLQVTALDIPGPVGRRLERRLALNSQQDLVLCWWTTGHNESASSNDQANLVLVSVASKKPELVSYTRTAGDLISAEYSLINTENILTVEQVFVSPRELCAHICTYNCTKNQFHRLAAMSIPLKANLICSSWSVNEDRILLADANALLILYDDLRKITQSVKAEINPTLIRWHPSNVFVFAVSARGDIQLFDAALTPLKIQLVSDIISPTPTLTLSQFFKSRPAVCHAVWGPEIDGSELRLLECNDNIALFLDNGPVIIMPFHLGVMNQGHLTPLHLVNQYIKTNQFNEAIELLSALNWNTDSQLCYACLSAIVNNLLRVPLDADKEDASIRFLLGEGLPKLHTENAFESFLRKSIKSGFDSNQLQLSLGTFYASSIQLSELTVLEYRDPMIRLARRFFHHLLGHSHFEKAFLLAVDIGVKDLFMDIYHVATDRGETALAEAARRKADLIEPDVADVTGSPKSLNSLDREYDSSDSDYLEEINDTPPNNGSTNLKYESHKDPPHSVNNQQFQFWKTRLHHQQPHPTKQCPRNMMEATMIAMEQSLRRSLRDDFTEAFVDDTLQETN